MNTSKIEAIQIENICLVMNYEDDLSDGMDIKVGPKVYG